MSFQREICSKGEDGIVNSVDQELLEELSDQGLHCLPRPVCPKAYDHFGYFGFQQVSKMCCCFNKLT